MSPTLRFILVTVSILSLNSQAGVIVGHKGPTTGGDLSKLNLLWAKSTSLEPEKGVESKVLKSLPFILSEELPASTDTYEEILVTDAVAERLSLLRISSERSIAAPAGSEMRTIVEQGLPENRICLTFLGDGYTENEKERFYADIARLTKDLFEGDTFASYLPLFNVYAVFTPSRDSGITDGNNRKQTAFGLYRTPAGSKRAILPGNTFAMESALRLAPKTDYPIVIANDEFYGGLGGRYAITTRSIQSGQIVLRHELGHNFGDVGEEYDGGQVYSGANSTRNPSKPSWSHWIEGTPRTYEMKMLDGQYLWQNLSSNPVRSNFKFPAPNAKGPYSFGIELSSVGWESPDDVAILLDGQPVKIEGTFTDDRSFFRVIVDRTLDSGNHTLEIRDNGIDQDNVLAFANLYAYEADYNFTGKYGSYMTYDERGSVSYRPTHAQCIMRDMLVKHFCSVDQENMWIRFLDRVSLVDSLVTTPGTGAARGEKTVTLTTPKLSGLEINWFIRSRNGSEQELSEFKNQTSFQVPAGFSGKDLVAKIRFSNSEIRKQSDRLSAERAIRI
jgi:hypothetical protein